MPAEASATGVNLWQNTSAVIMGSDSIDIALVLIGMILIGVVGALLSAIFSLIERRLCPWMNEKNQ